MDRPRTATIAPIVGRLVAAVLPLAAVALIRGAPRIQIAPVSWLAAFFAAPAAIAGLAMLVAVAAALTDGRIRHLADVAGLGMLAATFTVVALDAAGELGLGLGVTGAAACFLAGSVVRQRSLPARRDRLVGLIITVVLVDAGSAGVLMAGSLASTGPIVLATGAVLMALAALASVDEPNRATALGIAASSVAAFAIGGPLGNEIVAGATGIGLAAVVLGWGLVSGGLRRTRFAAPAAVVPALPAPPDPAPEPEYEELSRISRELRATLDDLVAARHLIELQRVEIDRVSSVDQLTGLANRWTTLDRLRTEAAEARRYAHPVAVVLLDVDGFTGLNHEHGLDAGDAVLRELALRLRLRMREADAVGRIGADAFLAILPHTDEGGATAFANAVLDRLLERQIVTARGEVTVRLSVGIALMRPGMTLSGDELLTAAEEALDSARAAGGNRIAFDRLHGLARLDERERLPETPIRDAADEGVER